MDFARVNTLKNVDVGSFMHLTMVDSDRRFYLDEARKEKPIRIKLLSLESNIGKRLVAEQARQDLGDGVDAENLAKASTDALIVLMEKTEHDKVKMCVALTVGWENITYIEDDEPDNAEGKILKFSPANAEKLYRTRPWIMEKVEQFLKDRSNFL